MIENKVIKHLHFTRSRSDQGHSMTGYKRAKAELIIASVQGRWEICSKSTVGVRYLS